MTHSEEMGNENKIIDTTDNNKYSSESDDNDFSSEEENLEVNDNQTKKIDFDKKGIAFDR